MEEGTLLHHCTLYPDSNLTFQHNLSKLFSYLCFLLNLPLESKDSRKLILDTSAKPVLLGGGESSLRRQRRDEALVINASDSGQIRWRGATTFCNKKELQICYVK